MADDYITEGEFGRTMTLLEELRDGLHTRIEALSAQLDKGVTGITTRQDTANGRTTKNEASVVAVAEQIDAIADQVTAVQATVMKIDKEGCQRGALHTRMITAMASAGVVPDTGELLDVPTGAPWTRRKTGAAMVGAGVGGSIVTALAPHVGPLLHWVATLFERGVR